MNSLIQKTTWLDDCF